MNKKNLISLTIAFLILFSSTFCLANNNETGLEKATNNVRNFVGGVENSVENAAMDVSNVSKDATGGMQNALDGNNMNFNAMGKMDNNYNTSRVVAESTNVMGMSFTAWTWIILGITAIGIIAIVWYYSMQFTHNNSHDD